MADTPGPSKLATATTSVSSVTVAEEVNVQPLQEGTVRVKLRKPKTNKHVKWCDGTVDNENMNKKKSKCCCIYKKPRKLDESSSSDSDEDCENCFGHKAPKSAHGHEPTEPSPIVTSVNTAE